MIAVFLIAAFAVSPEPFELEIADAVASTREIYPVPTLLVRAIIRQESNYDPHALSPAGAVGLMQIMPATAVKVGVPVPDLLNPAPNILAGVRLLAILLRYYHGDVISALVAYNARPREFLAPLPRNGETPAYVAAVLHSYETYRALQATPCWPVAQGRCRSARLVRQGTP